MGRNNVFACDSAMTVETKTHKYTRLFTDKPHWLRCCIFALSQKGVVIVSISTYFSMLFLLRVVEQACVANGVQDQDDSERASPCVWESCQDQRGLAVF